MDPMQEKLQEYARLLIQVGLHVEKGQTLVISSPVECAFLPACAPRRPTMQAAGRW